ncbi:MAG: DUF4445 domain-containing protein, partial [Planctomycetaceae bacterium]
MSDQQIRVMFQPHGRAVYVLPGTKIVEAAARAGLTIDTPCGGAGLCGKCRVRVIGGACEPTRSEIAVFNKDELADGWRLACQSSICQPSVIHIPETSIFASQHQILTESKTEITHDIAPAIRKIYVEMPTPTLEDNRGDLLRLEEKVGTFHADLSTLRRIGGLMSKFGYRGTAVLTDHRLIDFEEGDTSAKCYGAAFDIGTTTVVGSLMNLTDGEEVALASAMNPQVSFGDDVLTRIKHASDSPAGLSDLHGAIVKTVIAMLRDMSAQAGVRLGYVYEASFAGNTTMQHLLCGIDVAQLGQSPFVPMCDRGLLVRAAEMGLPIHPDGMAYVYPAISGFVGGDTVAGVLSARLLEHDSPALMVDVGTNGEIVLAVDGQLWAASTAAGPAFEGARISCGMRAAAGAIEKVVIDGDIHCGVIGDVPAIGLCGSGLIDLAAELLNVGIVSPEGRLLPPDELSAALSPALRARVSVDADGQTKFLIAQGSGAASAIYLTQRDI